MSVCRPVSPTLPLCILLHCLVRKRSQGWLQWSDVQSQALQGSVLHTAGVQNSVVQCITLHAVLCSSQPCSAVWCYTAGVQYSVVQCIAILCNVLQCCATPSPTVQCGVIQLVCEFSASYIEGIGELLYSAQSCMKLHFKLNSEQSFHLEFYHICFKDPV